MGNIPLKDACEWNPFADREATNHDEPHARAEVLVGHSGHWRLCRACAALPRFQHYKRRKDLTAESEAV